MLTHKIKIPATNDLKIALKAFLDNPATAFFCDDVEVDDRFIYVPATREFLNPDVLLDLKLEGKLQLVK